MRVDFDNLRFNLVNNFNRVVQNTDFSPMEDGDRADWYDLRHSIVGMMALQTNDGEHTSIFDRVEIVDIPSLDQDDVDD